MVAQLQQKAASPRKEPATPLKPTDVSKLLGDIANLNLNEHQIPGAKKPVKPKVIEQPREEPEKENAVVPSAQPPSNVIVVSGNESSPNGSESKTLQPATRWSKAAALVRLTAKVSNAVDNVALARIVHDFVEVLQTNRSKALTKEGFAFLAALNKQLEDPSVFITNPEVPRPLRTRSGTRAQLKQAVDPVDDQRPGRGDKMWVLRKKIADAPPGMGNSQLAQMVSDFEAVVKKSSGRCVTSDGLAFLAGVEERLKAA